MEWIYSAEIRILGASSLGDAQCRDINLLNPAFDALKALRNDQCGIATGQDGDDVRNRREQVVSFRMFCAVCLLHAETTHHHQLSTCVGRRFLEVIRKTRSRRARGVAVPSLL
jgi:hypothetical protein